MTNDSNSKNVCQDWCQNDLRDRGEVVVGEFPAIIERGIGDRAAAPVVEYRITVAVSVDPSTVDRTVVVEYWMVILGE